MMTDAYRVLGVSPTASVAESEARYRELLKEAHPDRHHGEGPEGVAAAEARTRQINDAMAVIRGRGDDPWLRPDPDAAWNRSDGDPSDRGVGYDPDRNDPGRSSPRHVQCELCDGVFVDPADLIVHRAGVHPEVVAYEVGLSVQRPSLLRRILVPSVVGVVLVLLALTVSGGAMSAGQRVTIIAVAWAAVIAFGYRGARRTRPRR